MLLLIHESFVGIVITAIVPIKAAVRIHDAIVWTNFEPDLGSFFGNVCGAPGVMNQVAA